MGAGPALRARRSERWEQNLRGFERLRRPKPRGQDLATAPLHTPLRVARSLRRRGTELLAPHPATQNDEIPTLAGRDFVVFCCGDRI